MSRSAQDYLKEQGVVVSSEGAKVDYETRTSLALTENYQKVTTGWSGVLENIGFSVGTFTVQKGGEYSWSLERIYQNNDQSPSVGVTLNIEIRKNNIPVYDRTNVPVSSATGPTELSTDTFNTQFITDAVIGDTFDFWVKGEDGTGVPPSDAKLIIMRIVAKKTKEI